MKRILRLTALLPVFVATLFVACTDADVKTDVPKDHNLAMDFGTADAVVDADIIRDMRLFTFYQGGANESKFRKEVYNLSRNGNVITASVETGLWHLAALSAPAGTAIIPPSPTEPMQTAPMYVYAPTLIGGKSTDAAEIFFANKTLPNAIVASPATNPQVSMEISRNVAMVELVIAKSTATFSTTSSAHKIKLANVPSTIGYTGRLLPSKDAPTLLASPLESGLKLKTSIDPNYLASDTVKFIIPAHKGVPGVLSDTTTVKMEISVLLERQNGTKFEKTKELQVVAVCNQILRVSITIDDGIEFGTELLPWERVDIKALVGEKYSNWLYVKKDTKGNGQSWNDALPTINAAVTKAAALKLAGKTVNGILVAGGSARVYAEGINVPADIRIFGGWEGISGTELAAGDAAAPYTSAARNLSKFKAYLSLGGGSVVLGSAGAVLDGFNITGAQASNTASPVNVSNATAWLNAVEIQGININSGTVLNMTAGKATNILVSGCNQGVSLNGPAKLINATIADNAGTVTCAGGASLLNSVVWWGTKAGGYTSTGAGNTIQNCVIQGNNASDFILPETDNNVPINKDNIAWFTTGTDGNVPGPNFNLTTSTSRPFYTAGSDRAPMIGRGKTALFNDNTTAMPDVAKKDINGNPRSKTVASEVWTDAGCYQETSYAGFKLRWASDRIYVSSKNGYITDVPLLLPEDNRTVQIGLDWEVSLVNSSLQYCVLEGATGWPVSGRSTPGEYVLAGRFFLKTLPQETGGDVYKNYNGNLERKCGTVTIHTDLGAYLPDKNVDIYQTPGLSSVWEAGYVGSFHRNSETEERYIHGPNTGAWTVRVTSGLDWIKIDGKNKGDNGRVVEDTFGGVITGTGNIKFRVGMKSTYTPTEDKPARYGLITIVRSGGVAMFFVRQGEEADYLYRSEDPRLARTESSATLVSWTRNNARKFSPFSLCDPDHGTAASKNLGARGGGFVDYPSQVGYFFQKNQTVAYLRGSQTANLPTVTTNPVWSDAREICPIGYRHATYTEWIESCYQGLDTPPTDRSPYTSQTGDYAKANFVWGRYADGYYDQIAPDPVTTTTEFLPSAVPATAADRPFVATKGILMVNHHNYASLFFPTAGTMINTAPTAVGQDYPLGSGINTVMIPAKYHTSTAMYGSTHWLNAHIGMTCTSIAASTATQVRCVKE